MNRLGEKDKENCDIPAFRSLENTHGGMYSRQFGYRKECRVGDIF